jgi:hypothetical protein
MQVACLIERKLRERLDLASLKRARVDEEIKNLEKAVVARAARLKSAEDAQAAGITELIAHRSSCDKCRRQ